VGDGREIARVARPYVGPGFSAACGALVLGTSLALAGSSSDPPLSRFEYSEPHMGTTFAIVLYARDSTQASGAARAAFARIAELDRRLTDYDDDSEAARAAREAVDRPVRVSDDLYRVLSRARAMSIRTGGAFDVTIGALTHVWRRARRQSELPDPDEQEVARAASGFALLRLDPEARTIRIAPPGVRFDFGGIAKGDAADRALETIRQAGVPRALVAAGGDVAAGAPPPDARGWHVSIAAFDGRTPPTPAVTVSHAGVSTSGDAEQWVEADGVRYSHILDPRTGRPLTGRRQATVVAPDATTSDMLATALCVLPAAEAVTLADGMPGTAAMRGTTDGSGPVEWVFSRRWPR
jgi:FAD:protein FMN transferase